MGERAVAFQLLAREDEALLVRGDALFVLDQLFDAVDSVAGQHVECNGPARRLDEYLHAPSSGQRVPSCPNRTIRVL